jgi:hypothetical protein
MGTCYRTPCVGLKEFLDAFIFKDHVKRQLV